MADKGVMLTKHEGLKIDDATVYASGNAYINCTFRRCTLVVTDLPFVMQGNHFDSCNWHINCLVMWGDPKTRSKLRQILDLIDGSGDMGIATDK